MMALSPSCLSSTPTPVPPSFSIFLFPTPAKSSFLFCRPCPHVNCVQIRFPILVPLLVASFKKRLLLGRCWLANITNDIRCRRRNVNEQHRIKNQRLDSAKCKYNRSKPSHIHEGYWNKMQWFNCPPLWRFPPRPSAIFQLQLIFHSFISSFQLGLPRRKFKAFKNGNWKDRFRRRRFASASAFGM